MHLSPWPWFLLFATLFRAGSVETVAFEAVSPARNVSDPVLAYLVGLLEADLWGSIDAGALDTVVERSGGSSNLPYHDLRSLSRIKREGFREATVEVVFDRPLKLRIPYSILGYKPGKLRGSQTITFRELALGDFVIRVRGKDRSSQELLQDVRLFAIRRGRLVIDIDGWIDRLAGGKLDDTRVTGLVLFRYRGERYGMAVGYSRSWRGRSGVLSLRQNAIRFPSPPVMRTAAWKLRQVLESYEPDLRPDSLQAKEGW